jgi:DNA-binding MarR family transcriptional regulator
MKDTHFEMFYANISGIYREIQRIRSEYAADLGIKSVQVFWLFLLKEHPEGMIASQLAAASQTNRSLVSRELGELLDQRLVKYEENGTENNYAQKIVLTAKGRKLAEKINQIAMDVQLEVSKDIPEKEMQIFYRVLTNLNEGFGEIQKEDQK